MKSWRRLAMGSGFLALAVSGIAQPYSIDSSTLDGGGGMSSGGSFSLTGTIGQPDSGTLSGGSFTLQGGFWPGVTSVTIPGGPTLFIELLGLQVRISWTPATPGFVLQQAGGLDSNLWSPAPSGAQNPILLPADENVRFYRLMKP